VRIGSGTLQSRSPLDVLNGANVAALRANAAPDWEVIQFELAELEAPGVYRLSGLLRGQAGTDGIAPETWPPGTDFVLLDGSAQQVDLPSSARGLERHFRVGPAAKPPDDPAYRHHAEAFTGVGLRPYAPVHLKAERLAGGKIEISWVRRTRIDGDSWAGADAPLGEERELYHVRVLSGDVLLREFGPNEPRQDYALTEQNEDGAPAILSIEVAQLSDRFGPGPYKRITFDG
jgi:hypothetical protein